MDSVTVLRSTSNEHVKHVRSLRSSKGRRSTGQAIAEGPKLVDVAAHAGMDIVLLVVSEDDEANLPWVAEQASSVIVVSAEVLRSISDTKNPQSPIAVFTIPAPGEVTCTDQVVLHDIADPGNVGTIVRTAGALGWDVALTGSTADPWSPKVVRSSAGAVFTVRMSRIRNAGSLRALGVRLVASVVTGGAPPIRDSPEPMALLIGSEAGGLPDDVVRNADASVTIPMVGGLESLNAAVAAGLLMYALQPVRSP